MSWRKRWENWSRGLGRAFSVVDEPLGPRESELLDTLATRIRARGLAPPAILFLESSRPLEFLGAQGVAFLQPFLEGVLPQARWEEAIALLSRHQAVPELIRRLEAEEASHGS